MLVVAAPEVDDVQYADAEGLLGRAGFARLAPGVAAGPFPAGDVRVQVVGRSGGQEAFRVPVPDLPPEDGAAEVAAPANVLDWEPRGTLDPALVLTARRAYALQRRVDVGRVEEKVLFAGTVEDGPGYLLGQFWLRGDAEADTVGVVGSDEDLEVQTRPPAGERTDVLVLHLPPPRGSGGGGLVVVPRPGTGQVLYSRTGRERDASAPEDDPALDGVVVLTREDAAERGEVRDTLRLLDGDGRDIGTFPVAELLCGETSCG
ncbi:MAG: hypothetical protein JWM64_279 [Frankiales bacterium]|nr:hypothetical protein [Frankiales bacterium]